MLGTAIAGAASGVVALLAAQAAPKAANLLANLVHPERVMGAAKSVDAVEKTWRQRAKALGKSAGIVALNSALLFVFYRAFFLALSP
eukprot:299403-Rhodomonas_salina.1